MACLSSPICGCKGMGFSWFVQILGAIFFFFVHFRACLKGCFDLFLCVWYGAIEKIGHPNLQQYITENLHNPKKKDKFAQLHNGVQ
jgi:hypothetical protein